jgi:putative endonuclease
MADHNQTGAEGEKRAAEFLKEKGYQVLENNWRFKNLEVDIIALHQKTLVIIEVKTRTGNVLGDAGHWVDRQKQKKLIQAANAYVEQNQLDNEIRFDIITIIQSGKEQKIAHLEDAFYAVL